MLLGINLLFLSRDRIHFPPLESVRTKNRPGTICVFNNTLSWEHQPGEAPPWLMGWDWQGRQREAWGHFAEAGQEITCACLSEALVRHTLTYTHIYTHACTYKHTCTWIHTHMHISSCTHAYTHMSIHTPYTHNTHTLCSLIPSSTWSMLDSFMKQI